MGKLICIKHPTYQGKGAPQPCPTLDGALCPSCVRIYERKEAA